MVLTCLLHLRPTMHKRKGSTTSSALTVSNMGSRTAVRMAMSTLRALATTGWAASRIRGSSRIQASLSLGTRAFDPGQTWSPQRCRQERGLEFYRDVWRRMISGSLVNFMFSGSYLETVIFIRAASHSGWRLFLDLYMHGFTWESNIRPDLKLMPKSMGIFFHH